MISAPCAKYWACYIPYTDRDAKHCVYPYNKHLEPVRNNNCQKEYDRRGFMDKQM